MRVNIVWTAVISAAFAVSSIAAALVDAVALALAFGLSSIASATLSSRER